MFNGIIEGLGEVADISISEGKEFTINTSHTSTLTSLTIGESICVNGTCTTVTKFTANNFSFYASKETLAITNLNHLSVGSIVNLERSLAYGARISGHTVYGHVDGMLNVNEIERGQESWLVSFTISEHQRKFMIPKGSIALNGVSLTINELSHNHFKVMVIPHTLINTNIQYFKVGEPVNYEFDPMAKFIKQHIDNYLVNLNIENFIKR